KPQAFRIEPVKPIPAAVVNPVQAQVESLAAELNAAPVANHGISHGATHGAAEVHTLGGKDSPVIEEAAMQAAAATARYPATESYRPLSEQPLARTQPEKKAGWSLFGRRKAAEADIRAEPLPVDRPRAGATPMQRTQAAEPAAPQQGGEDLFPDHG